MLSRCNNPTVAGYENYGGRGIKVCERWLQVENFVADMGEPPIGMLLDRIDNNKDYEPGNCRWATREDQNQNRRNNRLYTHDGQTMCLASWAKKVGFGKGKLRYRLEMGLSISEALTMTTYELRDR
jgi:hypothetical protein